MKGAVRFFGLGAIMILFLTLMAFFLAQAVNNPTTQANIYASHVANRLAPELNLCGYNTNLNPKKNYYWIDTTGQNAEQVASIIDTSNSSINSINSTTNSSINSTNSNGYLKPSNYDSKTATPNIKMRDRIGTPQGETESDEHKDAQFAESQPQQNKLG